MPRLGITLAILLAGCATVEPQVAASGLCYPAAADQFIGQTVTGDLEARMLAATGAKSIRWVRPGMMITMEYSAERLTVQIDPGNRISAAHCG